MYNDVAPGPYGPATNRGYIPNPFFTVANQFMPRNFKEVLRWADYITMQSPTAAEVIRKHATYPITDFLVDTDNEKLRKRYEAIFKAIKLKHSLNTIGFDFYTRGNVFVSVYLPFNRMAVCPRCFSAYNVKTSGNIKYSQYKFIGTCASDSCEFHGEFKIADHPVKDFREINIIQWDPNHIVVNHNPISGKSEYYYSVPAMVRRKVMLGDPTFTATLPMGMLDAIAKKKQFKFDNNTLFHLANVSIGKMEDGLCIPPIMSIYSLVFHQAMLRRANEAIATEHMTPLRVLFPQAGTANGDPMVSLSLGTFAANMEDNLRRFKQDPNRAVISPIPVGYQAIGGEGKNLLVAQELQLAEESILMSLGMSRELMAGTTNWTSSDVGLRLLKNTMENYTRQIQEVIDWLMSKICAFMSLERAEVTLTPFELTDDDFLKQLLPNLIQNNNISMTTALEALGMDYHEEMERMKGEMILKEKVKIEVEDEIQRARFNASRKAQSDVNEDTGYEEAKAKAYDIFLQVAGEDPLTQQAYLMQLEQQDKALYTLVQGLLERIAGAVQAQPQAQPGGEPGQEQGQQQPEQSGEPQQ